MSLIYLFQTLQRKSTITTENDLSFDMYTSEADSLLSDVYLVVCENGCKDVATLSEQILFMPLVEAF